VEFAVEMSWAHDRWKIATPITVCRVAPPARIGAPFDPDAFDTEPAIVDLGYRWCERFNADCPDGEFGHVQVARLMPVRGSDFELALAGLRAGFEGLVENCVSQIWSETRWDSPISA
jgi:hypothetical protein